MVTEILEAMVKRLSDKLDRRVAKMRRPRSQISPYEMIGQDRMEKMKMPPAQEVRHDTVQGCGDPRCQICMPTDRPQDAGGAKVGPPPGGATFVVDMGSMDSFTATDLRNLQERTTRQMEDAILYGFSNRINRIQNVNSNSEDRAHSAAREKERQLRETVEKYVIKTQHAVAWDDVIGNEEARRALIEAIEHPIKHKAIYAHYGKKPTKGVMLYGPPGCGKTMFGKAAASIIQKLSGQSGEGFMLKINGPEIQTPYVGQTEAIIRSLFAYARAYKAAFGMQLVIFIDEADAILPSRDGGLSRRALPWEESQVATFLTELDGLEDSGALVILATNRPHAIDNAILRDGRVDRKIKIERPTREAAKVIFQRSLVGVPVIAGQDRDHLADAATDAFFQPSLRLLDFKTDKGVDYLTLGDIVNGAMIVGIVEQAKANAFQRDIAAGGNPTGICYVDIERAIATKHKEAEGLDHSEALIEFLKRIDANELASVKTSKAELREAARKLN